ncbi:MAG: hypothetical protein ACRDDZ_01375 [Marinifilaceae bacterium]
MKKQITRINFDKNIRIDKVCANNDLRPTMECIYFEGDYMYATDANMLVKLKISECCTIPQEFIDKLNGKLLPSKAYAEIIKYDTIKEVTDIGIRVSNEFRETIFKFREGKFPNADYVLNQLLSQESNTIHHDTLFVNPELICAVSNAMPFEDNKKIRITRGGLAFIIRREKMESVGLVMGLM